MLQPLPNNVFAVDITNNLQIPTENYTVEWMRDGVALLKLGQSACVVDLTDFDGRGSCTCSDFLFRYKEIISNPAGLPQGIAWGCKHLKLLWYIQHIKKPSDYPTKFVYSLTPLPAQWPYFHLITS